MSTLDLHRATIYISVRKETYTMSKKNGIKIERGVQLPDAASGKYGRRWPYAELKVGDSFFVPDGDCYQAGMPPAMTYWKTKLQRKFTSRKVDGGVRIWRTE
jgi:hypothetical protein